MKKVAPNLERLGMNIYVFLNLQNINMANAEDHKTKTKQLRRQLHEGQSGLTHGLEKKILNMKIVITAWNIMVYVHASLYPMLSMHLLLIQKGSIYTTFNAFTVCYSIFVR